MIASNMGAILAPNGRPAVYEAIENNWYEGSRWSPNRSWVWFPVQDAKKDLDRFTRYELIKHSRYLYKNSPFIRGLIERLVNLTIGTGLKAVPISSSKEFNRAAKKAWKKFCRRPCVDSRMSMGQYMRIKTRERYGDGEGFTALTYSKTTGRDAIQGLEADRITSTQSDLNQVDAAGQVDGIKKDSQGMPSGYYLRGAKNPLPADCIVHHFTPMRSGQERGEPVLAAAINTARDVDDILALEKSAVKEASSHRDIIETQSGEFDPEAHRLSKFNQNLPVNISLPADDKAKTGYYKVMFQGEPILLRHGDKYTPYKSDRPGQAWQGFMDFLANTICLSTGLPPCVVLPVNVGGTDIRRDLELAQRIITPIQEDLSDEFQMIWEYVMQGEIDDGRLPTPPPDWNEVRWHFPKSITVDRGRDAMQDRSDVMAGLMSHEEYHGRYGDDAEEYEDTVIEEVARRRDKLEKKGFKSILEFVQLLSLDSKLFTARITEQVTPGEEQLKLDSGDPAPDPAPNPAPAPKPKVSK